MIDYNLIYVAPMAPKDDPYAPWTKVEMKVELRGDCMVVGTPLDPSYERHYYRQPYFSWLLYTGVITEKKGRQE